MIAIIDYGLGNVGSIKNMLMKVGEQEIILAHNTEDLANADKLILPGVGSFDAGIKLLNESKLRDELDRQVLGYKKPILGICLGMQMFGNGSEEGSQKGLGYIDFECHRFHSEANHLKVPHMGWDYVKICKEIPLTKDLDCNQRYYFVHSYYAQCNDNANIMMLCNYGIEFVAGVQKANIYGTQFHPEKSHRYGMQIFHNFVKEL